MYRIIHTFKSKVKLICTASPDRSKTIKDSTMSVQNDCTRGYVGETNSLLMDRKTQFIYDTKGPQQTRIIS